MIIKLPFKKFGVFIEKPVEILFNIGVLESVCEDMGIEFWEISEKVKPDEFDFSYLLLYHGYLRACEKRFKKARYNKGHAAIWYQYMSNNARLMFRQGMSDLFGKIVKNYKPDKKKVN